ncbi:MAG: hypothetical protein RR404_04205 [Bacilli bacterium]
MLNKDDNLGKIVLAKNLVFLCANNEIKLDHAYNQGRAVVIISEQKNNFYVCPCTTSNIPNRKDLFADNFMYLNNASLSEQITNLDKSSRYINAGTILQIPICWRKEFGKISEKSYFKLINLILTLKRSYSLENFNDIKEDLLNQQQTLAKTYSFHL